VKPDPAPSLVQLYEATIEIGPRLDLGASAHGHRFHVDILGGHFQGPRMRGRVLPGGADRQLLRSDGVKELSALYEMQTDDGAVLSIRNHVLLREPGNAPRYARSVIRVQAPRGPYEWLSQCVIIGTLRSLRPERDAVLIRAYAVE